MDNLHSNNSIQFARVLAAVAGIAGREFLDELAQATDLAPDELQSVLARAESAFEDIKAGVCPAPGMARRVGREVRPLTIALPDGSAVDMVLIQEPGGLYFCADASYVEQHVSELVSPHDNGPVFLDD